MEVAASPKSPSPGPNGAASAPLPVVEASRLVDYLVVMLEATLGATRQELEFPGSLLSSAQYPDTVSRCSRFAADSQVALYLHKDLVPPSELQNGDVDTGASAV